MPGDRIMFPLKVANIKQGYNTQNTGGNVLFKRFVPLIFIYFGLCNQL